MFARPISHTRLLALLAAIALPTVFVACGGSSSTSTPATPVTSTGTTIAGALPAECAPDYVFTPIQGVVPLIIPAEMAKGDARFTFALEKDGVLLNDADVALRLEPCTEGVEPVAIDATWRGLHVKEEEHSHDTTGTPTETAEVTGVYAADVNLPVAGRWVAQFDIAEPAESPRVFFNVAETATTPAVGSAAPIVETAVLAPDGSNIKQVSTANPPRPEIVSVTLEDAVAMKKPLLLIIATPAFCRSRVCGPQFDEMMTLYDEYKDRVTFLQVEPYLLDETGQPIVDPTRNDWTLAPIVPAYGLPDEPWTFVIDSSGNIAAKYEGIANADEVSAALTKVLGRY